MLRKVGLGLIGVTGLAGIGSQARWSMVRTAQSEGKMDVSSSASVAIPAPTVSAASAPSENSSASGDDTDQVVLTSDTLRILTEDEKKNLAADTLRCEQLKYNALQSKRVQFLLHNLGTVGCPVPHPEKLLRCSPCDLQIAAAIVTNHELQESRLILCQNHKLPQAQFTEAVTHELVHLYDMCRAKIRYNCDDVACMEIRAPLLSGECRFSNEFRRGRVGLFDWSAHLEKCVRRRALMSLAVNDACKNKEECEASLNRVWNRCFNDTAPFYTIPHED